MVSSTKDFMIQCDWIGFYRRWHYHRRYYTMRCYQIRCYSEKRSNSVRDRIKEFAKCRPNSAKMTNITSLFVEVDPPRSAFFDFSENYQPIVLSPFSAVRAEN